MVCLGVTDGMAVQETLDSEESVGLIHIGSGQHATVLGSQNSVTGNTVVSRV